MVHLDLLVRHQQFSAKMLNILGFHWARMSMQGADPDAPTPTARLVILAHHKVGAGNPSRAQQLDGENDGSMFLGRAIGMRAK